MLDFFFIICYNKITIFVLKGVIKLEKVSKRLNEALYKRNIRPVELSEKTGISKASISQYCSGVVEPKQDRIDIISNALNVNPAWLCGFDVPMELEITQMEPQVPNFLAYGGSSNANTNTKHPTTDFTYAMYEEEKNLTEEDKDELKRMAKILSNKNKGIL